MLSYQDDAVKKVKIKITKIKLWINGKTKEDMIEIEIPQNCNTLRRLKDTISNYIYCKNLRIYNHQGLEIDDADIEYLESKQVLYVSQDGAIFNLVNYINEYEFIKWIKSGGYALNVINNQYCAIKKIDISNLQNDEIYNIYREALYLESFRHKNIVKFFHSFIYDNNFYTVMELARGGELGSYIDENKYISEKTSKRLFRQIHDAVIYIHSKSVIHRDLKPNNILFLDDKRENLIIIDFGISGFYSGNIKETIKAGTTRFLPPELASGFNFVSNPKIDIWALGVILYLMVFGAFPFDGTDSEITHKIIKEEIKFPPHIIVSKALINLINGMLEKNSQFRADVHSNLFEEWYNDESAEDFVVIKEEYIIKKNTQNEINKDSNNNNNNVPQINNNSMNNFNSSYGKISTNQSSIDKDLRHSSELPNYIKKSPSIMKQASINLINNNNNNSSSNNHNGGTGSSGTKAKIMRKSTIESSSVKRSFDFSAVASDIIGSKANNLKSTLSSKSQSRVKK